MKRQLRDFCWIFLSTKNTATLKRTVELFHFSNGLLALILICKFSILFRQLLQKVILQILKHKIMTVGELKNFLDRLSDDIIVVTRTDDPDVLLDIQVEEKNINITTYGRQTQYSEDFSGIEGLIISPQIKKRSW